MRDGQRTGGADGRVEARPAAELARSSGLVRGAASSYAAQGLAVASAFFLTPFVLHQVGREHFGLWVLVGALVSYGSLLDLGVTSAVVKYVAEYRASGRTDDARALIATALWFYGIVGALVIVAAAVLAPFVPGIFGLSPADRELAIWLTVVTGVGVGVGIPFSTPRAVLRGLQRFDLANAVAIAATLLTAAGTIAMLLLGRGILSIVVVSVVVMFVLQPVSVWLVRRTAPDLGYGWRGGRRASIRTIVGFSSSVWVMQIAGQLLGRSSAIIIGLVLPVASVTPFALAQRLSALAYMSISELPKLLMPLASRVSASRDRSTLRSVFLVSTRVTLAVGVGVATVVAVLGRELLEVWVGAGYAHYAPLVALLSAAVISEALSLPGTNILLGAGHHRPLAAIAISVGVVNVVLAVVLVLRYELVGVAVAALASRAVGALLVQTPYAARVLGIGALELLRTALLPVVLPATALVVGLELLSRAVRLDSIPELALAGGGALAAYAALYVLVGASPGERAFYRGYATRARSGMIE